MRYFKWIYLKELHIYIWKVTMYVYKCVCIHDD